MGGLQAVLSRSSGKGSVSEGEAFRNGEDKEVESRGKIEVE